jgi:Kef-type K+ transport system membrane component KefB
VDNPTLLLILADIALIIGSARLAGLLFARFGQPPVIGEIIAGLLLGPSFLGAVLPESQSLLFPQAVQPHLYLLAQIGLIFYMFLVGLELNPQHLRKDLRMALVISSVSILLPFSLGVGFSHAVLFPLNAMPGIDELTLAIFVGAALSITAFAVLARVLSDLHLVGSPLGTLALTCASIDDISAWCLLAIAIAVTRTDSIAGALPTIAGIAVYALMMATVGRRLAYRLLGRYQAVDQLQPWLLTLIYVAVVVSAIITESIGIDVIFGGFILGAIMPKNTGLAQELRARTEDFVSTFLLPMFFTYSGLNTQISLLNSVELWMICAALIGIAVLGKHTGVYLVARYFGMERREAGALGWLMNTRGLTELIILNVGLKLNVISPTVFTLFVIMALATTVMAAPMMKRVVTGTNLTVTDSKPKQ